MDEAIQNVKSQRNASYILEPLSLRGSTNYFSFTVYGFDEYENKTNAVLQALYSLEEGDIVLFENQIFGMNKLQKRQYLHIGITPFSLKDVNAFIIKESFEIISIRNGKMAKTTKTDNGMILNKLNECDDPELPQWVKQKCADSGTEIDINEACEDDIDQKLIEQQRELEKLSKQMLEIKEELTQNVSSDGCSD